MIKENAIAVGTKLNVFEREGFETERGEIVGYKDDCVIVKVQNQCQIDHPYQFTLKIPLRSITVSIFTRGNSLSQYKNGNKEK